MHKHEKVALLKMLDSLMKHYEDNPNSLIAKVFGVYSIETKLYASMDFLVMQNVSHNLQFDSLKVTFDLKGSSYNRNTKVTS
jgi:hypothetical protein